MTHFLPIDGYTLLSGTNVIADALCPLAAGPELSSEWLGKLWENIWDPWFVFGMMAQGVFFMRFMVQWIVSERKRKSTIPVAFWYLSLVGGLLTFVYACKKADPVFMLGQLLACVIYVRNLMLIYGCRESRKPHASPVGEIQPGANHKLGEDAPNGLAERRS